MYKKVVVFIFVLMLCVSMAFGSGFSIYEQGAKATALGGAFIAQANDATAVFYNPAGITSLEGTNFGLGTTIIMPSFAFTAPAGAKTDAEDLVFPPSTFYFTHQINEQLTAGFGFFTLFGLGSEWKSDWLGRELATNTRIHTYFLNPTIAYKFSDQFSAAVGVDLVLGSVIMERSILANPAPLLYVESKLDGTSNIGFGFNIGAQFKANDQLTIGAVYRSNVKLKFEDGDVTFEIPAALAGIAGLFPDTKGTAEIELPNLIGVGISYDFNDQVTAEFDYMQLGWSSYDKLVIKFEDAVGGSTEASTDKKYEDSYSLRFGLEYRVDDNWALRGGFIIDNHAVPDDHVEPTLPEGDRNLINIGVGYKMDKFSIDVSYTMLMQDDREIKNAKNGIMGGTVPFNGTYEGSANLFGLSLGYSL